MKACLTAFLACSLPLAALAVAPDASQRIDRTLEAHWEKLGLTPQAPVSDETFVRRIYLDAVGRIPTAEEAEAFLNTSHPDKRAHLIDELLDSAGYGNHMFNWWADLLRVQSRMGNNAVTGRAYAEFVLEAMREDMPYDEFTRQLLTAEGFAWENGAVGFYLRDAGMALDHLATTVQVFLGTQVVCAQCHDHPFDSWTQMDYYHMAAYTYGVTNQPGSLLIDQRQMAEAARESRSQNGRDRNQGRDTLRGMNEVFRPLRGTSVADSGRTLRLPADYQYSDARPRSTVEPQVPFGPEVEAGSYRDRRAVFADWMTSPENPRFTLAISNRLWKKAFGVGLIEPVDDLSDRSQAAVPELMALLEEIMKDVGYSQRDFLRVVFNTQAYQREAAAEEVPLGETYHFTGPLLRRMSAEQAWDSVVTLMHGDPDLHTERLSRRQPTADQLSADMQRLVAGITSRSPQELLQLSREASRIQSGSSAESRRLTERLRAAREEGDSAEVRTLSRQLTVERNRMRSEVVALAANGPVRTGGEAMMQGDEAMMQEDPAMMAEAPEMMMGERQGRGGGDRGFDQLLAREIASDLGLDPLQNRDQLRSWMSGPARQYLRASHVNQPAPRGHFLRLFGQSDREVVENASKGGSIGQALNLLNGPLFTDLQHPLSAYRRSVAEVEGEVGDRIERVYLNLLARRPTAGELELILSLADERGEQLLQDVTFALLNGQEFLFIQ